MLKSIQSHSCRTYVHVGTRVAILIQYFIGVETKQQSYSFSLLTTMKRNKLIKALNSVFLIEYNFL